MNWPGGMYDPESHIAYLPSFTSLLPLGLLPPPNKDFSDIAYVEGDARFGVRYIAGPGEIVDPEGQPRGQSQTASAGASGGSAAASGGGLNPQGLPIVKPPYGRITAIDLDTGEIVWQVAHGETPDAVRNHPALKGLTIPRTGQAGYAGALITKTLVIAGEPQLTTTADHPRGAMLRAYDKATGKEVGAVWMPAPQSGTPMTYSVNGRQFVLIAISGGTYSGEYVAFALPR